MPRPNLSVYLMHCQKGDEVFSKIGVSKNVKNRVKTLSGDNPGVKFTPVYQRKFRDGGKALFVETEICRAFKDHRKQGREFLNVHPDEVLKNISSMRDKDIRSGEDFLFTIKVSTDLAEWIANEALKNRRSISMEINYLILEAIRVKEHNYKAMQDKAQKGK